MTYEEKMAFNLHAKAQMRKYLASLSWEEKVASIERMNAAGKIAREGMRKAMAEKDAPTAGVSSEACDVKPLA